MKFQLSKNQWALINKIPGAAAECEAVLARVERGDYSDAKRASDAISRYQASKGAEQHPVTARAHATAAPVRVTRDELAVAATVEIAPEKFAEQKARLSTPWELEAEHQAAARRGWGTK